MSSLLNALLTTPYVYVTLPLIAYVTTSQLILHFPSLLYRRNTALQRRWPTFGAHRGGGGEHYENTLGAFANAIKCGCDLLELDVALTRDGVVVVTHDADTARLATRNVIIRETNFAELPTLRPTNTITLPAIFNGPNKTLSIAATDVKPTPAFARLDDVLKLRPSNCWVNIDLKDDNPDLPDAVESVIRSNDAMDNVIWGSVKTEGARAVAARIRADDRCLRFLSGREALMLILYYVSGLLPFMPVPFTALEIPLLTTHMSNTIRQMITSQHKTFLRRAMAETLITAYDWISTRPSLIHHLQARNTFVCFWVLNDADDFRRAYMSVGANAVMTDFPTRLQAFQVEYQAWKRTHHVRDEL